MTDITVLCKVVDNFGDAGVVLRLVRALETIDNSLHIRIITDSIEVLTLLQKGDGNADVANSCKKNNSHYDIDAIKISASNFTEKLTETSYQIFDWTDEEGNCTREFTKNPPRIILECFACGRPDWLENLLFENSEAHTNDKYIAHIINVEFLTAENYAEEFHLMKSGTRNPLVKKSIFMPGFTPKTGGLILDGIWEKAAQAHIVPYRMACASGAVEVAEAADRRSVFNILLFAYEQDFSPLISAFSAANKLCKICVHVARGASFDPFLDAWKNAGKPFEVKEMPFLPQTQWDSFLANCDFLFVRGEDSLSRACLSGVPFVWQAYRQAENYQLVKVDALLERMKFYFNENDFALLAECWRKFNLQGSVCESDLILELLKKSAAQNSADAHGNDIRQGFEAFAKSLYANGDMAKCLLENIKKIRYNIICEN